MATTTTYGYTNGATAATKAVTLLDLDSTKYALVLDEPTECRLINTTASVDREETLSYRARSLSKVNTTLEIQNPSKVQGGVQYQVQTEAVLTTEDPTTGFVVNEPVVVNINVRHPRSGNVTAVFVQQQILRTLSGFINADGTWRIDELMRSALKPTKNF